MRADKKEETRSAAAFGGLSIIAMWFMDHVWIRSTLEDYQRFKTLLLTNLVCICVTLLCRYFLPAREKI